MSSCERSPPHVRRISSAWAICFSHRKRRLGDRIQTFVSTASVSTSWPTAGTGMTLSSNASPPKQIPRGCNSSSYVFLQGRGRRASFLTRSTPSSASSCKKMNRAVLSWRRKRSSATQRQKNKSQRSRSVAGFRKTSRSPSWTNSWERRTCCALAAFPISLS